MGAHRAPQAPLLVDPGRLGLPFRAFALTAFFFGALGPFAQSPLAVLASSFGTPFGRLLFSPRGGFLGFRAGHLSDQGPFVDALQQLVARQAEQV